MRFRTKTTGPERPTGRFPRARVTLPLMALVAAALAAGPAVNHVNHPDEAAILSMAATRGLVPITPQPDKGTEVYQWDAELADFQPTDLGRVVDPHALFEGQSYVLVRHPNPHRPGLYLGIDRSEMRYWVRKPSP